MTLSWIFESAWRELRRHCYLIIGMGTDKTYHCQFYYKKNLVILLKDLKANSQNSRENYVGSIKIIKQ